MTRQRFNHILLFFLIISSICFIVPASGIAQSDENPAGSLTSRMKLDTLRAYVEERIDTAEMKSQHPFLSAAEIALGTNLKAYFTLKVPSMTILTKDQTFIYSRALFGLNLAF
jgi:hypothetical protein